MNGEITELDLPRIHECESGEKISDFHYYLTILSQYNLITGSYSDKEISVYPLRVRLDNFVSNGGFMSVYYKHKREITRNEEIDRLSISKLRNETWLIKCQKWTYWPLFIIGIAAFSYSTIDYFNKKESQEQKEMELKKMQSIESELATLRTLILDQTNRNFLHDSIRNGHILNDSDSIKGDMVKK